MQVKIDTRPLLIVILSRWWRFPVFLLLGYAIHYGYGQKPPEGLSLEGYRALLVFLTCLILWVTRLLPLAVTGLFAMVAPPLLGVMPAKEAFAFFGSEPVFFIMGVFILATALLKSGLSTRLALHLLKSGSKSPKRLVLHIMLASALLSFVMSEHAVAAMMFPLIVIISKRLNLSPQGSSYGRILFLAMAWGCVIGGIATMLGGARVALAVGLLQEAKGGTITFAQWTVAMLPLVLVLFVFCYFLLTRFFSIDIETVEEADSAIQSQIRDLGRPVMEEQFLGLLMIAAIFSWVFFGMQFGMASISILAVVLLFMFRVVEWKDLQEKMEWGVILMYGGAIAISSILNSTGAGLWFTKQFVLPHLNSTWMLMLALSLLSILLAEAMSPSAVVAIVVPIGMSVAKQFGLDPKVVVYAVASASGLAYALPMSTPPVALAYSSGYLRMKEVILPASLMALVSWLTLLLTARFWWPVLGIHVGG
ncbi:MAG TPA: DASS family sodium-coupled anion symporter [Terriglobia bacterium]|nr:DASS family sodium-coupled anion symporter [Terriglobia bacterium]